MCVCVHLKRAELLRILSPNLKLEHLSLDRQQKGHRRACNTSVFGLLTGVVSKGRGQGTLRILRKDWGTLGKIRGITITA